MFQPNLDGSTTVIVGMASASRERSLPPVSFAMLVRVS